MSPDGGCRMEGRAISSDRGPSQMDEGAIAFPNPLRGTSSDSQRYLVSRSPLVPTSSAHPRHDHRCSGATLHTYGAVARAGGRR